MEDIIHCDPLPLLCGHLLPSPAPMSIDRPQPELMSQIASSGLLGYLLERQRRRRVSPAAVSDRQQTPLGPAPVRLRLRRPVVLVHPPEVDGRVPAGGGHSELRGEERRQQPLSAAERRQNAARHAAVLQQTVTQELVHLAHQSSGGREGRGPSDTYGVGEIQLQMK